MMRIALAGLGNVGSAVLRLLRGNADLLASRAGQTIEVVAVSARNKDKKRDCDLSGIAWVDDPIALASLKDVDVVVEAIGGAGGIARELAAAALANRKHVVTANKALIAAHGVELAVAAESAGVRLSFEASVCGAVPVMKTLREGLSANRVSTLRGILNGTCNYILTRMEQEGVDFSTALQAAQQLGYAESDPSDDIDGVDTANKLAILTAVAFGRAPDLSAIFVEGIRNITQTDLQAAAAKGGRIKLLGIAERTPSGIVQRVQPVFVPIAEQIANVSGVMNALEITGDFAGKTIIQGQGAGDPTASAIVADLVDIVRGNKFYAFGVAAKSLASV